MTEQTNAAETEVKSTETTETTETGKSTAETGAVKETQEKEISKETTKEESTLLGKEAEKTEEQKVESKAPEKYDLKVPEGFTLDQVMLDKVSPVFKEIGLTNDQAQKLADVYAPYVKQQLETQQKESIEYFQKMVGEWKEETIKELGAEHQKELALAARAIDKANIPGLRELLNETGVGNSLPLVKFMIFAGKLMSQDTLADSSHKQPDPASTEQGKLDILYPSMKK